MFNSYDEKRYESFQKLLGTNDGKKSLTVTLDNALAERLRLLAAKASAFSGNSITENAIMEEGISIYIDEFEEYLSRLFENFEDSGKYLDDIRKLTDQKFPAKLLEEGKKDSQ